VGGICGVRLTPLADALREFILSHSVIHADETPVSLLAPGRGKTKRAYVWVFRTTNFVAKRAVLFDFAASRAGEHPRRVLQGFDGTLVADDYSGYLGLQAQGVTAALCWAHARRKLFEAHEFNGSQIAGQAVTLIAKLYEVEREARELEPEARWLLRQQRSRPIVEDLHVWLTEQRQRLANADVTAKAIDYSLSNWRALTRYLERRQRAHRQQRGRERGEAAVHRSQKLALCRVAAGRRTRRRGHEPDRVGQTQRARSLGLSQGRLRAPAHAQAARPRPIAAAQLAPCQRRRRAEPGARHRVNPPSTRRHRRRKDVVRGTLTPQASHCSTWPPRAAVRQRSMQRMTRRCPRLSASACSTR
jgi:hypothetical protein